MLVLPVRVRISLDAWTKLGKWLIKTKYVFLNSFLNMSFPYQSTCKKTKKHARKEAKQRKWIETNQWKLKRQEFLSKGL